MPAGDILPLLLTLFGLIAVGQLLRLLAVLPASAPEVLARVIVQVTMPALIVVILARARFEPALLPALLATTLALLAALALGALWLRLLGADRPAQGAAGLVIDWDDLDDDDWGDEPETAGTEYTGSAIEQLLPSDDEEDGAQ